MYSGQTVFQKWQVCTVTIRLTAGVGVGFEINYTSDAGSLNDTEGNFTQYQWVETWHTVYDMA